MVKPPALRSNSSRPPARSDGGKELVEREDLDSTRPIWGPTASECLTDVQAVEDLGLTIDGEPTVAALVLLARPESLMRLLAQAEVVFECRSQKLKPSM